MQRTKATAQLGARVVRHAKAEARHSIDLLAMKAPIFFGLPAAPIVEQLRVQVCACFVLVKLQPFPFLKYCKRQLIGSADVEEIRRKFAQIAARLLLAQQLPAKR